MTIIFETLEGFFEYIGFEKNKLWQIAICKTIETKPVMLQSGFYSDGKNMQGLVTLTAIRESKFSAIARVNLATVKFIVQDPDIQKTVQQIRREIETFAAEFHKVNNDFHRVISGKITTNPTDENEAFFGKVSRSSGNNFLLIDRLDNSLQKPLADNGVKTFKTLKNLSLGTLLSFIDISDIEDIAKFISNNHNKAPF